MELRPRLIATALAFGLTLGMAMPESHAQIPAPGYAVPADGTLLTVAAQAESRRVPDVAHPRSGGPAA